MPLGDTLHGLIVLAVVVIGSVLLGNAFRRIAQPAVLGPITLGLVVGTTVMALPESIRSTIVPDSSKYLLGEAGNAGLLLLMFSVGVELRGLRRSAGAPATWHLAPCVLIPMLVCALVAWPFAERLGESGGSDRYGWLFVGIALGITAVPVLVLIIADLGIGGLAEARAALHTAVVTDGFAWILVTILVAVTTDLSSISVPALVIGLFLLVAVVWLIPRFLKNAKPSGGLGSPVVMMLVAALAGATATQLLGFHPAIGAVIAGFRFPAGLAVASSQRSFGAIVEVLLPAFFVSAAMSVPLQALRDQVSWGGLWCLLALAAAAFVSKVTAGIVLGSLGRWQWRASARLGVLLNCRGVTEIAIASVGFQAGLIGAFAFAALCALAIVTTAVTAPLYRALGENPRAGRLSETAAFSAARD